MQKLVEDGVFSNSSCLDCIEREEETISYLILNQDPNQGIYAYSVPIFDLNHKLIRIITFSQSAVSYTHLSAKSLASFTISIDSSLKIYPMIKSSLSYF